MQSNQEPEPTEPENPESETQEIKTTPVLPETADTTVNPPAEKLVRPIMPSRNTHRPVIIISCIVALVVFGGTALAIWGLINGMHNASEKAAKAEKEFNDAVNAPYKPNIPAGPVAITDTDTAITDSGKVYTKCYSVNMISGYKVIKSQGCALVLGGKQYSDILDEVIIRPLAEGKSVNELEAEYVAGIEKAHTEAQQTAAKDSGYAKTTQGNADSMKIVSKASKKVNGYDAHMIDYKDGYGLLRRYYIIKAPSDKYSYNDKKITAYGIEGYVSTQTGVAMPLEAVINSIKINK